MVRRLFSGAVAVAAQLRVLTTRHGRGWRFATVSVAVLAGAGMTTMVANATRVAAIAEDASRMLGLRSPGERAADVTATKRRQAQISPLRLGKPVRSQVLSNAVDPAPAVGAGSPLAALLEQPGFVAPASVTNSALPGDGGGPAAAVAGLPPSAFTPGGSVIVGGGGSAGGGSGGGSGGGGATSSTGGATSTGGTGSTSTGGVSTTSTGGTSTTSGGTTSSTGGDPTTSTGGSSTTSTGGETTTSGGIVSTSTGGTTSSGGVPTDPNVPAVPEPSTWLMMLAGFAAIGTAMRRAVRHVPARRA
jgi:hypothetical protein